MQSLIDRILEFRDRRDWEQFHNARTLATSILIESAELVEIFQWIKDEQLDDIVTSKREEISEEISDIMIYILLLAHHIGIDLEKVIHRKIDLNEERYPVDQAKGNANKYTDF